MLEHLVRTRRFAGRLTKTRRASTVFLCLALSSGCATRQGSEPSPRVDAADIRATIRFLADDLLEGRGPGTRGDVLARRYIATEMESVGLQPGMPDGSWEQPVPLVGVTTAAPKHWEFHRNATRLQLAQGDDFVASSSRLSPSIAIRDAELVFVGYGIEAPEFQWDDFKGTDVRGKILVFLNNDPDWDPELFAGTRRLYYGRWTYKFEVAARHGAAGAILIHTTESASYPWQTVQTSWSGENSRLPQSTAPEIDLQAWITEDAAARLLRFAGRDLDELRRAARGRDFKPVALSTRTSLTLGNRFRHYQTANVIGRLPASSARQRDEAVIYTAHHDHLGSHDDHGAQTIFNGAVDNAAGVAQLLAIARAFREAPPSPRSVYFIALAAEEQGLLGSAYFAAHPLVTPKNMVANINIDGGNIWGKTRDVAVTGLGKSTIDRWTTAAAARQGRVLVGEAFPERGSFYRSDQFNFAKIGVPVLYAHGGTDYIGRPPEWGRQQEDAWNETHYHQPSDDFDPSWNLDGMIEDVELLYDVGQRLASDNELPTWTPGDEFERARAISQGTP